jgi:hypothetical protein
VKGNTVGNSDLTSAVMDFIGEHPSWAVGKHPGSSVTLPGGSAKWQTFKREAEQAIAAIDQRIGAFREKLETAGPGVRARYSKDVAALEQKNRDLKKTLVVGDGEAKSGSTATSRHSNENLDRHADARTTKPSGESWL